MGTKCGAWIGRGAGLALHAGFCSVGRLFLARSRRHVCAHLHLGSKHRSVRLRPTFLGSKYAPDRQALRVTSEKGRTPWVSANEARSGGSTSRHHLASEYDEVLKLEAKPKRRSANAQGATRRIRHLTHPEADRLLAELPPHQRDMAAFSLAQGWGAAKVTGLRWSALDLDRRQRAANRLDGFLGCKTAAPQGQTT